MLTASLADLMPEALEFYSGYLQPLPCGGAIVTLLALGMLTAGLLGRLLPEETELAAKYGQNTARTKAMRTALITGTALLLHNFPEGIATFARRAATWSWDLASHWPSRCTIFLKVWRLQARFMQQRVLNARQFCGRGFLDWQKFLVVCWRG